MLSGILDINELNKLIETKLKREHYSYKITRGDVVKVNTSSTETYHTLITLLKENNLIGYTFSQRSQIPYRVVVKGIHPTINKEDIKKELAQKGHIVKGEIINIRSRVSKKEIPIQFINIERKENNRDIFEIEHLCNLKVTIEPPHKKKEIVQCMRCQQYGHTKNNCFRPPRCVRCGDSHLTANCTKPKSTDKKNLTCALCMEQGHPASYKGCKVYTEIFKRKFPTMTRAKHTEADSATQNANKKEEAQNDDNEHIAERKDGNTRTYAEACNQSTFSMKRIEGMLEKQTVIVEKLMTQMSSLMEMLTKIINKIL